MSDLKKLEILKIVRELQFLESDYQYKTELIRKFDPVFLGEVDKIIGMFPDLSSIWIDKSKIQNESIDSMASSPVSQITNEIVLVPSDKELIVMNEIMEPLIEKKITNYQQLSVLKKLRDTLLPKLMSGEVRVAV